MGVEHVNRGGETYVLQHGTDKRGKARYWFGRKVTGKPVAALPEGYEIYEKPEDGQVFLRKIKPSPILPLERELVWDAVQKEAAIKDCVVEIEGKDIVIYLADIDPEDRLEMLGRMFPVGLSETASLREIMLRNRHYKKMMRFTLEDGTTRLFRVDRWCFLGSIDRWYFLAGSAPLAKLLNKYVKHLGRESFFDLM